ncbi:MAG TPA: Flp family type IVb pilin [Actinomycetota bacterium]
MLLTIFTYRLWLSARLNLRSERGATALEYAIVAAGIAAVVVLAVALLGGATNSDFACTAESWETRTERC